MILWEDQRWDFKFSSRTKIHFFGHRGAEKGFSSSKAYFRCWINNVAAFQKVWTLNLEFFIWSNFTELSVTKKLISFDGGGWWRSHRAYSMRKNEFFHLRRVSTSNTTEHSRNQLFSEEQLIFEKNYGFSKNFFGPKNSQKIFTSGKGIKFEVYRPISKIAFPTEFTLYMGHRLCLEWIPWETLFSKLVSILRIWYLYPM